MDQKKNLPKWLLYSTNIPNGWGWGDNVFRGTFGESLIENNFV